jgi:fatty-acyl-CoA synthase
MPLRFATPAPEAYPYPLLIRHLLPEASARPHGEIVYRDQFRGDYETLRARIARLAGALTRLGVTQGSVVAMMDWDSHRYLEAYFAIPMLGAVLQTVNVRLSPEQIAYTIAQTQAEVLIHHRDFTPLVEAIAPKLSDVRVLVEIADGQPSTTSSPEYEALLAEQADHFDFVDFDENAIATTFHTTGTTGLPKAVSFSHRQLVLHTLAMAAGLANQPDRQGLRRQDVYMPLTPMFHVHAWGVPYVATMLGMKQVYPGRYEPGLLLELHRREQVTISHCVPTILSMLLAALPAGQSITGRWTMIIGGSALSEDLRRQAQDRGIFALVGFGMSETAPFVSLARADTDEEIAAGALTRAGYPAPLVKVAIAPLSEGEGLGELLVRAPWLTQDYRGQPEASQALWEGGWLHTQDVAQLTPMGEIQIVDRLKDLIKSGGEWLSSAHLESLLCEHLDVDQAAFVGIADARWGERPAVAVVLRAGAEPADATAMVRGHLRGHVETGAISAYALPDCVLVLPSLPLTSVGKIDKKVIKALAEGEPAS